MLPLIDERLEILPLADERLEIFPLDEMIV